MDTYKNDQEASYDPTQQTLTNPERDPRKICERENGCLIFNQKSDDVDLQVVIHIFVS